MRKNKNLNQLNEIELIKSKRNNEKNRNREADIIFPKDYLQLKDIMLSLKRKTSGIVLKFCDYLQIIFNCCYISM